MEYKSGVDNIAFHPSDLPIPMSAYPATKLPAQPSSPSRFSALRSRVAQRRQEHAVHLRYAAWALLAALFLAFLIYALWYDAKAALPLLVITILAVVGVVYFRFLSPLLEPRVDELLEKIQKRMSPPVKRYYGWAVAGVVAVALLVFLVVDTRDDYRRLISLLGIFTYVFLTWALSTAPLSVRWRPVLWGLGLQFAFGLLIIRWSVGAAVFAWLGDRVTDFLGFTSAGTQFVYGFLINVPNICQMQWNPAIAFSVFPNIIFFSSCVSVLYYYGVMQWLVKKMAGIMQVTLGTTAAESLSSAGNVFLGMTEAPLLIRPYMKDMTASELNAVMVGGFSTIAGTVFGVYVSFGTSVTDRNQVYGFEACANHLLSASVMSAPAALAMAKLIHPETEESKTKRVSDLKLEKGTESNAVEAAANGASTAIYLVANIIANIIAFLAILAFANAIVGWLGSLVGIQALTIELILSYAFYPLAWVMGASNEHEELLRVGELMGVKTILNEFIAYKRMGDMIALGQLSSRAQLVATYALCGFSNVASVGITLGALGGMCPEKVGVLARCALRAVIAGSFACFLTACVAGLLASDVGDCMRPAATNATQCIDLDKLLPLVLSTS